MASKDYDWKNTQSNKKWPYKEDAPFDIQWQKDRAKEFKKNGNGWWWYSGVSAANTPEHLRKDNSKEVKNV